MPAVDGPLGNLLLRVILYSTDYFAKIYHANLAKNLPVMLEAKEECFVFLFTLKQCG